MASDPGAVYEAPEQSVADGSPPQKGHGCFFYGCIFAIVLGVLAAVGTGLAAYFGYRWLQRVVDEYTSTTPMEIPAVKLKPEEQKALDERVANFRAALDKNEPTEPLVLTEDELNALIAEKAQAAGRVYVQIEGDKLKGQVSLPLDKVFPQLKGRYFNGKATFRVALDDGKLVVFADSAEANGKPLPPQFMGELSKQNLAEDANKNPENAATFAKFESIHVKDGKIIIKGKAKAEGSSPEPSKEKDGGEPSKEKEGAPPAEKPEPKSGEAVPAPKEPAEAKAESK